MKKAIVRHHMIEDETPIIVGLSGGKDSLTLLWALKKFLTISKYKYQLAAGHVCLGFPNDSVDKMQAFCDELSVPFFWEKTQIGEVIFDYRQESNPCSLCAKMRRGALNSLAKQYGYPKVALAHHQDDVAETMLLNLFFEGRIGSFKPVTYLDRMGLTVIRPFIYVPEEQISYFTNKAELPVSRSNCPQNCLGKRQEMKQIISQLESLAHMGKDRLTGALDRMFDGDWDGRISPK
ncbi:MAG: tRNA 2-thiocytidine biosynthesis protein TtcA [Firmicutes bacterium]|nr:tRNA 2-thiocytidine biosynthesis protein TtcA [Bacillota bacterium]